eukprot:746888-Hanusia_phi.AAC.2
MAAIPSHRRSPLPTMRLMTDPRPIPQGQKQITSSELFGEHGGQLIIFTQELDHDFDALLWQSRYHSDTTGASLIARGWLERNG